MNASNIYLIYISLGCKKLEILYAVKFSVNSHVNNLKNIARGILIM